jgi:hypothetical protein
VYSLNTNNNVLCPVIFVREKPLKRGVNEMGVNMAGDIAPDGAYKIFEEPKARDQAP